ncbi:SphA family protein [Polluticoccus soli]|uniref:SphA family protein n=1 Tax=Polluticoccus soli TaxID=3034150 RepID=UPI0023E2F113|nr:transporter [Flavipsychrobacter sp. JY13-12]
MKTIKFGMYYAFTILVIFLFTGSSWAQLKGHHLLGDYGLNAGSQPPPGFSAFAVGYNYRASELKNDDGNVVLTIPEISAAFVGGGVGVVTNLKILNANYGASILGAFMSDRIEGNLAEKEIPMAFTDLYIQPIQLGWHCKKADFLVGYAVYIPTGEYQLGGGSNNGLGMWTNEVSAGATYFFDEKKMWSISSIFFYEIHTDKKNSELRVGNIFNAEGGIGKAFYHKIKSTPVPMIFHVGGIYYGQFKVTNDDIPIGPRVFTGKRDRIWAGGLEGMIFHPKLRTSIDFRWLHEFGARNRFEGDSYLLTIGYLIRSYEKHAAPAPAASETAPAE